MLLTDNTRCPKSAGALQRAADAPPAPPRTAHDINKAQSRDRYNSFVTIIIYWSSLLTKKGEGLPFRAFELAPPPYQMAFYPVVLTKPILVNVTNIQNRKINNECRRDFQAIVEAHLPSRLRHATQYLPIVIKFCNFKLLRQLVGGVSVTSRRGVTGAGPGERRGRSHLGPFRAAPPTSPPSYFYFRAAVCHDRLFKGGAGAQAVHQKYQHGLVTAANGLTPWTYRSDDPSVLRRGHSIWNRSIALQHGRHRHGCDGRVRDLKDLFRVSVGGYTNRPYPYGYYRQRGIADTTASRAERSYFSAAPANTGLEWRTSSSLYKSEMACFLTSQLSQLRQSCFVHVEYFVQYTNKETTNRPEEEEIAIYPGGYDTAGDIEHQSRAPAEWPAP
ncbi:hypothetical protein EVAR_19943_1 [Eumeta japonica]|uniref:Uncharacterized protein n=1 Tax=Eumeta variegata TaxID=151549 RepID=A0A4C1YJY2_EUMVA|nr:hypothetical protein EVAR_19943_1 [Eumeta japonica]